jgi:tRNA A37 threonylcarbamoyladenosine synthetase subunit TsaC/SUA5/YrdC
MISKRKEVGIRVPDNRICLGLVAQLGHPVLNTSVQDINGELVADPAVIEERFGHLVDLMLDGGPSITQVSTVIDLSGESPVLVRQGAGDAGLLV